LRLVDLDLVEPAHEREESLVADIRDQQAVEAALVGAAGVLHLGALADEADFHELAEVNILGTYHVLEAARRAGAGRVVFAGSNRVSGFYPRTTRVVVTHPPSTASTVSAEADPVQREAE
jgi:uronate dehydrogenase